MKKEQMVGTRLPDTVVQDLEAIEQVEQADRSTTVRKLLSRAIQDWKWTTIRVCTAAGSSRWHVLPVRRESHSGK
jgi:metal-responsive CopG/Arc/MetJ family transcriptional regulator